MTVELAPELEAEVEKYALAKGMAPQDFIEKALANAIAYEQAMAQPKEKEDIRIFLDRLANIAQPVDVLKTETFSREMIYADDHEKFRF